MTSSGKIRIYELSRDLNLENKDVLNAAKKLSITVKSHSSSISDNEAKKIREFLGKKQSNISNDNKNKPKGKEILSVKKAVSEPIESKNKLSEKSTISSHKKTSQNNQIISKAPVRPSLNAKPKSQPSITTSGLSRNANPSSSKLNEPQKPTRPPEKEVKQSTTPLKKQPEIKSVQKANHQKTSVNAIPPEKVTQSQKDLEKNQTSQIQSHKAPLTNKPPLPKAKLNQPKPLITPPPTRPKGPIQSSKPGNARLINSPKSQEPRNNKQVRAQKNQPKQALPNKPSKPSLKGNSLELVGAPIRRNKPNPNRNRDGYRGGGTNYRGGPNSSSNKPPRDGRNPMRQRPGMPSGMRRPVAPGELMQIQKPTGGSSGSTPPRRPGSPPQQRRPENSSDRSNKEKSSGTKPTANRPATANRPTPSGPPKKPSHRPGAAGSGRRRSDWDDSAKLEALRNKTPQKQRQKVHIIGENDDSLTTETSGFASEQDAVLLSASLARPSNKPKDNQKASPKTTSGNRKRKKESTRQRQRRRAMELRAAREAKQVRPEMIVVPEDNLTVQELADKLSVESSEIIKSLFFKGITATVTESLDLSTIETVAEEFGVPVLQDDVEEAAKKTVEMIEEADKKHLIRRPPVVTVMGHVDHGKTSLLDAIRKARVAAGEAGGITQHIGAYQIEIDHEKQKRKLTFLDTPGHEAFTAMRARGTKVTDVAVLVVAADDGVRPQTLEAISHARAAKVPIVVAINKIDKEGSSPDRVKQELSEQELVAEEWGGDIVMVPVSAIKGENIDKLLEMILLVTEVEDLQANPDRLAKGTVIEAHLDKAKGPVATLLIQNGTLKSGDVIAAGQVLGKVRAMVDENGGRLKEAGPSCPVEALGFNEVPTAGDEFEVYQDEKSARSIVGDRASDARATRLAQQMATRRVSLSSMSGQANEGNLKELNLILKADVQGSIEAILGSLEQLPKDEVQVRVLLSAPGEITETDVDLAAASGAVIVGFNTSMASGAKRAADTNGVDVRDYEVIYKLLEDIQSAMEGLLEPDMVEEKLGQAEVRAIFTIGRSAVAGCYINNGKLQRNCRVRVNRGDQVVFEGDLDSLRRNRDDVKEVASGFECGIGCDRFANWQEGDIINGYKLVTQRRKLTK